MPSTTRKRTSAKNTKTVTEVKRPVRKATFEVKKVKGVRQFSCVNKRAHKLARVMGKRSKLSVTELKTALKKRPNMRAFAYEGEKLVKVTF